MCSAIQITWLFLAQPDRCLLHGIRTGYWQGKQAPVIESRAEAAKQKVDQIRGGMHTMRHHCMHAVEAKIWVKHCRWRLTGTLKRTTLDLLPSPHSLRLAGVTGSSKIVQLGATGLLNGESTSDILHARRKGTGNHRHCKAAGSPTERDCQRDRPAGDHETLLRGMFPAGRPSARCLGGLSWSAEYEEHR